MSSQAEIDELVKLLVKYYRERNTKSQEEIASRLNAIGEPALPAVINVVRTPRDIFEVDELHEMVCPILARMGEGIINPLLAKLEDSNGPVRAVAICVLRKLSTAKPDLIQRFTDLFMQALNDSDAGVRYEAVLFLGHNRIEAAFDGLVKALYDREDYSIARAAARYLAKLGGQKAILPLCEALEYELKRDPEDWLVRGKVTKTIVEALEELNAIFEIPFQTLLLAVSEHTNSIAPT